MHVTNNFTPSGNSESQSPCHYICHVLTALLNLQNVFLFHNFESSSVKARGAQYKTQTTFAVTAVTENRARNWIAGIKNN